MNSAKYTPLGATTSQADTFRESLCSLKIHNFLFAKVNSAKNLKSQQKNELQCLLKLSDSCGQECPLHVYSTR